VLTLAVLKPDWNLSDAVVRFNNANSKYRIQLNDYSEFDTADDNWAGRTRLSTEIISGKVPDILAGAAGTLLKAYSRPSKLMAVFTKYSHPFT